MLHLPRREDDGLPGSSSGRLMARVAVLKGGRSLERQVSLASGAQVEDALQRLGHDVVGLDVGHDLVARLRADAPDVAFIALHGRDGEDGTVQELLEILDIPYTGSGVHASVRCADKALAKHAMRDAGPARPRTSSRSPRRRSRSSAPARRSTAIEERLDFPLVVKPAEPGLGARASSSRPPRPTCPAALVAAFSYAPRVLLERYVPGRDLAVSVARRRRAAGGRGGAQRGGLLRLRGPLHDRAHDVRVPGRAARRADARGRRSSRWTCTGRSAAAGSRAST